VPTVKVSRALLAGLLACALGSAALAEGGVEPIDSDYDRQPLHTVVPEYPEKARRNRIEGEVQVCFDITREGFPRRIAVRRSSHRYFEKAARNAVRRSTWQPIPQGREVPAIKACRTYRFALVPVPPDEREPASSGPHPR
jgi:TonB family protein